jgi:hypothetical protein
MLRLRNSLAPLFALALATACGGGGSGSGQSGAFVDSLVTGLRYVGPKFSGHTTTDGRYQYVPGDEVCFFVGTIALGCGQGRDVFSPLDLFPGARSDDAAVINVVRFLLSLDVDGDPDNGIDLRGVQTVAADDPIDFEQSVEDFGNDPKVLAFVAAQGFDGELVDEETAATHFEQSLDEHLYFEQQLLGRWLYTAFEEGVPDESFSIRIDEQDLEAGAADVTEDDEVFFARESGKETCFHEGMLDAPDLVSGDVECVGDALALEALRSFRMDLLDGGTRFATSDLFGAWWLVSGFGEGEIAFDEGNLADFAAELSEKGALHFETLEEGGDCAYDGRMNDRKDFASGQVVCSEAGKASWSMELIGDEV